MPRRRDDWSLRIAGSLFGLGCCAVGLFSIFGAGEQLPEFNRERALGFGVVALVVGLVALLGSLMGDARALWYCMPRRWRPFRADMLDGWQAGQASAPDRLEPANGGTKEPCGGLGRRRVDSAACARQPGPAGRQRKEASMEWTGGCLCGAVRYRARSDPIRVVNCHCGMCRRTSGAAFMTFVHFPASEFAWTGAQPTRYRSSDEAERGFCATCGSTVSMHETVLADRTQVSLGSLDRPDLVRPDDHVWTSSQLPWLEVVDDLPRFATVSDAVPSRALGSVEER